MRSVKVGVARAKEFSLFGSITGALFLALACFGPQPARAAYVGDLVFLPPHANYQVIKTEHFKIVYPAKLEKQALASAKHFEEAYQIMGRAFQHEPGHRVTAILADNHDSANGITSVVGLQGMVLFVTAPDPASSIGDFDDWLRSLVIHEYAHYVTMVQTGGLWEVFRYVFGNLLFPNQFWPAWLAEGMAVYAESAFTLQGRGYGPYYNTITRDGIFRKKLGTKKLLDYDTLSGPVPDFPFGESYYYAGFGIIDELSQRHGETAPARYALVSSYRFPFFLDGALEKVFKKDHQDAQFKTLWRQWISRQIESLEPELSWLAQEGGPEPKLLTPDGDVAMGARLAPDETRVAYVLSSGHHLPRIEILDTINKKTTVVEEAVAGAGLAWSRDGRLLIYAKTDFQSPYRLYSDLYVYDTIEKAGWRLTDGERAKDPAWCGSKVVFTSDREGISQLRVIDLPKDDDEAEESRVLYTAKAGHHVANPRCFMPEPNDVGEAAPTVVYFSEHGTEPMDAVYSIPLDGGAAKHAFGGPKSGFGALFPEPFIDGSVYFTRVKSGYYDLARWNPKTREITPLARASGGFWLPSVGMGRIALTYLTSTGIRAGVIDKAELTPERSSAIAKAPAAASTIVAPDTGTIKPRENVVVSGPHGYNLLTSLQPRIWSPYLLLMESHRQIGAELRGWDDTDQLEYGLRAYHDSIPNGMNGAASTFHRIASFRLGLAASSELDEWLTTSRGTVYNQERKLSAVLSRPFPSVFSSFTPSLVGEWARTTRGGILGKRIFLPEQRFGGNLVYDSTKGFAHSLTDETGATVMLLGRRYYAVGSRANKGYASWRQLLPVGPKHANLSLHLAGANSGTVNEGIPGSVVKVGGHASVDDLDLSLRGYPQGTFHARRAAVLQAEYRLPLFEVFSGLGNVPFFLRNVGAFAFADTAKLHSEAVGTSEPIVGVGGGLLLNTTLAYMLPIQFRLEFATGLNRGLRAEDVFNLRLGL